MNTKIIIVKSITHAMRGQKLLESANIRSFVERNESAISMYGCGYGLRVKVDKLEQAVNILTNSKIKISGILN